MADYEKCGKTLGWMSKIMTISVRFFRQQLGMYYDTGKPPEGNGLLGYGHR